MPLRSSIPTGIWRRARPALRTPIGHCVMLGAALFLAERNWSGDIINVWAGIVGRDGIEPDTFYMLQDGKPVATIR